MKVVYVTLVSVVVLVGLFIVLKPKHTTVQPKTITANIVVKDNKVVSGPTTITAHKGDTIDLKITNDQPEELHMHGYDKKVDLEANKQAELTFQANLTGQFEYELEHSGTTLGQLQVQP